jgi:hypothetical protein
MQPGRACQEPRRRLVAVTRAEAIIPQGFTHSLPATAKPARYSAVTPEHSTRIVPAIYLLYLMQLSRYLEGILDERSSRPRRAGNSEFESKGAWVKAGRHTPSYRTSSIEASAYS